MLCTALRTPLCIPLCILLLHTLHTSSAGAPHTLLHTLHTNLRTLQTKPVSGDRPHLRAQLCWDC
jgi:hypothetical protein